MENQKMTAYSRPAEWSAAAQNAGKDFRLTSAGKALSAALATLREYSEI
jgi:hypothetical protein